MPGPSRCFALRALLTLTAALAAGCAAHRPAEPVPAPRLELLGSEALDLPAACEPVAGRVYRTRAVVGTDGRVSGVAAESGEGCVQEALLRWVESFRFRPLEASATTHVDWMGVEAGRGG
jgi:hypothetical protein